jgi:protein XagA
MNLLKSFTRLLLVTVVLFIITQNSVYADGGFPVRPGRLLISPSVGYFFANSQWDSTGVKKAFPNGGKYSSIGITLYSEYGISRRFAAVASLPYVINNYTQNIDPKSTTSSGLTDLETGIRYYLANINYVYYISLQGTAITPLYSNNASLGYGEEGAELKLAFSGSGHLGDLSTYFNASDGVRQYFGTNGPIQNRYSGTYGLSLDKKFENQISVSVSGINSFSDDKRFSPILETNKDFSFVQASLSYGHSFTREFSVFASGGKFLTGRNTGDGTTLTLALIYRLDYR